jgi:hypothetical protein
MLEYMQIKKCKGIVSNNYHKMGDSFVSLLQLSRFSSLN